jgi:alpha-2-macroglobulin
MKTTKFSLVVLILLFSVSCGQKDKTARKQPGPGASAVSQSILPLDKGFSEYIAGYTSGIVSSNSVIEIRFTPSFAEKANKQVTSGIFRFDPSIKGKTEWTDDNTLVFRPSKLLEPGKVYTGELDLYRIGDVRDQLKIFPLRIQTLKKDFGVTTGILECKTGENNTYTLNGDLTASDYIDSAEVESFLTAKIDRKKLSIKWDHSDNLIHKFTIGGISRSEKSRELVIDWDGTSAGVSQKGSTAISIPAQGDFIVMDVKTQLGENQKIELIFSDPVDPAQDLDGLIFLIPAAAATSSINNNIVTLIPSVTLQRSVTLNVEQSVKNYAGKSLSSAFSMNLDLASVNPSVALAGKGVILPTSQNLIFPFTAASLKAVDLTVIKIFENNLPYFLQEYDLNSGYNLKRFGRPVFRGKIDLLPATATGTGTWKLYTINLNEYIDVEPGVLYKVKLGMRRSYAMVDCPLTDNDLKYDELLQSSEEENSELWDNPDVYYDDVDNEAYYSMDYRWEDRDDPCKGAYYSPDKNVSRNVLASNLGIIAKMGIDNNLHVMINDLVTALPTSETTIEVYDYQMQLIASGTSNQDGDATIHCLRKPFLVIARKDKDRNYLKLNDGNSLSLSSFDVAGNKPENGIKAFVYGERDVWRPGDSIFLSVFIKDMNTDLPAEHPVQFELLNPQGQRVDNQIRKPEGKNLLSFISKTSADAMTGNYQAIFKIGGATFSKRIRIETVKPNRLKINLSFPGEILGGRNRETTGTLNVKWLNGLVAKNLKTSVEYILKHTKTQFDKYGQYIFDDPVAEFYSETVNIFNSTIDENGNATVKFEPGDEIKAPGMLTAVFTTRVQETGGDESITQTISKYAPYPVFVGMNLPGLKGKSRMLFTDADNEVRIVTVDEKGKPVKAEVEISVYKLNYRWWWESENENLSYYISSRSHQPVLSKTVVTGNNGEGSLTFNIDKREWGRYLIRATNPGGHSTGKILLIDWPWEYGMKGNTEGATLLSISTDKEKYTPGEEVSLSFPSMENARAIITLENSTGIIDEIRVPAGKGNTEVRFKVRPEMAPNVYAYVSVIQPHSQTVNDLPVRLYGVVPVMVEDPGTRLVPQLKVADEIRSQKPFEISVSETNRQKMTYTVAVVDEGLLDITGFKTPDPWNYFYAREALGVMTWDLYDYVLGAFGGTLDRIMAVGGDEALIDKTANKARRFIPVVKFLGPFTLEGGKVNTHTVTLPQYTGSVRVMVIAGNDRAFGSAEKSVAVKDPLMVLVTAPRIISPGETAALPVTLFIQKEGIRTISLKAESNEMIRIDESSKSISAGGIGESNTEFTFTASEKTGTGKIKITASGGGETAVYELEIEIRSPNPAETRSDLKVLKQGDKFESSFKPFGIEGTNSAVLEVSGLPSVNLEKRLDYLLNYPYGCSEQITSSVFPQLWLKDLSKDPAVATTTAKNIKEAVRVLVARQLPSGGITLWPGNYQPDEWVTSYAGHFMLEAERMGYNIPAGFRQKWVSYQKKMAQGWRYDQKYKYYATEQAYRLFTLALAGQPEKGAMNRLREAPGIPATARWLLAASFATTGRTEIAGELLDVRETTTEPEYYYYNYGSRLRDRSIILYTLTLTRNIEQALPLLNEVCESLGKDTWYSTQSIAWGLFAYMKWIDNLPSDKDNPVNIKIDFNGEKSSQTIGGKMVWKKDLRMTDGNNTLTVENTSANPVYVSLIRKGVPLKSDAAKAENGISMKVEYLNLDSKPIDHKMLVQGTDFMMIVKVTNTSLTGLTNLALTQMVPSGWEIQNTRLFEANYGIKESSYDYRDFRDDRVNTFFSLATAETKTFVLILNAAYRGDFLQPSLWCEAMYTENCYSRIPGGMVKVTGN